MEYGKIYEISFDYSIQKKGYDAAVPGELGYYMLDPISQIVYLFGQSQSSFDYWDSYFTDFQYDYPSSAGFNTYTDYFCYPGPNNYYENAFPNYTFNMDWHHGSKLFSFNHASGDYYLNLMALSNSCSSCAGNSVYLDNFCLNESPVLCNGTPIINYTINGCDVEFEVASNQGETDLLTFTWDFGDGTPFVSGDHVNHSFLWDGKYNVCVTMDCGSQQVTECVEIEIGNQCDNCNEITMEINSRKCESGAYIANFNLPINSVPYGYTVCNPENGQSLYSNDAKITTNSYVKNEFLKNMSFSINIEPYDPNFSGTISIFMTLCDLNGDPHCYEIISSVTLDQCDECIDLSLTSYAICEGSLCFDANTATTYQYGGEIDIPIPTGAIFYEVYSEQSLFKVSNVNGGNIKYQFRSNINKPFKTHAMFVFNFYGHFICYNVEIIVNRNCPELKDCNREKGLIDELILRSDISGRNTEFFVYPIPASNSLFISSNEFIGEENEISAEIVDQLGKVVLANKLVNLPFESQLDVSQLSPGIFYMRLLEKGHVIGTEKIMIIR